MPPKGKADTAGYQQLKKDLSAQAPGKLYILHGEETYLRDYCLNQLKELILSGGMGTFNFHEIPAKEMSPRRLEEALDCLPMMAQRTLVQVTDFDLFKAGEKDREAYAKLFEELPDYVCLVFVYDLIPYKGDARTKLAGAIKRSGVVVNFARQETGELVKWVRRRFRALGKDIDGNLASELIFLCGDLMTNLIGEIEKIGAYAKGTQITRADIDAVATPQLDTVVFRMTDAIGAGKFDQAAQVLGELFQMQEPPIKILWSLGRNMRQLYSARLALEKGRGAAYVADLWGLRSFQAEKIFTAARRFSLPWCRRAVVRCGEADLAMKSTGQDGQWSCPLPPGSPPCPGGEGVPMLKIREAIAVEGRYDKNTLSQVVDTLILETHGFGIFKDPERMALLRRAAEKRGLIVLTDSDGAGFVIRNRIKSAIPGQYLKHAYIPDVYGKEKRKRQRGKEGKLGVEGMSPAVLEQVLRRAGATFLDQGEAREQEPPLTKADLFAAGLTGRPDSAQRRLALLKRLELPEHMTANALLEVLNTCYTREEALLFLEEK